MFTRRFSSVQSLSPVQLFVTLWTAARQASLSITDSWSLLKLRSIESVMPSNNLILCHPLLLLPSIFPSISIFSNESVLHTWGQRIAASASASVLPMNIQDWFPLDGLVWSPCSPGTLEDNTFLFFMALVYISPRKLKQFQWKYLANI